MKKLTIREIRQSLSHLDRLLETEGEVMVTRMIIKCSKFDFELF
jgi:hypothetical protein